MRLNELTVDIWAFFIMSLIIWCWATARIELWVALLFLLSKINAKISFKWPEKYIK